MASLEFFFDVGSPYSHLAATQLEGVAARTGARVRWRPFLLGAVLKAAGPSSFSAVKARYLVEDLGRWAAHYGERFVMSPRFPLNTLLAQRTLTAAGLAAGGGAEGDAAVSRAARAVFAAFWVEDRDVSEASVLVAVLDGAGLDGAALVAAAGEAGVKEALRSSTEEAIARGAFGAPTFFVGEAMYWGNDRLEFVEQALSR